MLTGPVGICFDFWTWTCWKVTKTACYESDGQRPMAITLLKGSHYKQEMMQFFSYLQSKSSLQNEQTIARLLPGHRVLLPSSSLCLVNHQHHLTKAWQRLAKDPMMQRSPAAGKQMLKCLLFLYRTPSCTSASLHNTKTHHAAGECSSTPHYSVHHELLT